jgi:hypothetical protein
MNMQSLTQQEKSVKGQQANSLIDPLPFDHSEASLSWDDRRELLKANLRLLSHRLRHNVPILSSDISQTAVLADDADQSARAAA